MAAKRKAKAEPAAALTLPGTGLADLSVTKTPATLFIFEESVARVDWDKAPTQAEVDQAGKFLADKFGEKLDRFIHTTQE